MDERADKAKKVTRRKFLGLSVGAAGSILISGLGCGSDKKTGNGPSGDGAGRDHYKVFSQGQIANMLLKNRLVRSPTGESMAVNGEVTDDYISLHRALAEGGVGMIITGFSATVE